jgi:hypothetical protein
MTEHTFNNFSEFADFLSTNVNEFSNSAFTNLIKTVDTARKTNCGACKRKHVNLAEDTYKNLFTLINQEEKQKIKTLLNVESVKFFYNNAPMFTF